jgi:ABC-type lipoprotein release transport system permease subunit
MRAAAESGNGHLRIAPRAWLRTREEDVRLEDWARLLAEVRATEGVAVAAPHARTDALLAMGTRTSGVVMVGVEPQAEPRINRLVRSVAEGEYLARGETGRVVVGKVVAKRLDVGVGDDLMVTASGRGGEMRGAMLRVRGVVSTGSEQLDGSLCHVLLADLGEVSGYDGASEISILLQEPKRIEDAMAALRPLLAADQVLVTWEEIVPELASGVEVDETWSKLMVSVVLIVVFLGIASAQLAAVLERRKEFAVLSAIGMKGGRLVRVMLAEGAILGVAGASMALLVATPLIYAISVYGINFSALYGDADLAMSSILMDPVIFGDFDWWIAPLAFALSLGATTLSSLYPAWYALGTDPAAALRVEE